MSLLTPGIQNISEPMHIYLYGSPEVGKTNISNIFMELVPKEHKDIASDFTPRVLMYSNLSPATIISINDKILNDSIGSILNQVADNACWHKGKIIATTIGQDRVNLVFPKRCLLWINANKHILQYNLKEVDPMALVGRFSIYEKTYTDEQKKKIFVEKGECGEVDESKISELQKYINEIYEHPRTITCSKELRNIVWDRSKEMEINSIRQIGRNLTMCQVMALVNNRTEVSIEDIEKIFALLKTEEKPITKIKTNNIKEISDSVIKQLVSETIFKSLPLDKKLLYSENEIQKKLKVSDVCSILDYMEETKLIESEVLKIGRDRIPTKCYYILENHGV